MPINSYTRRQLIGTGALGLAGLYLAGCGGDDDSSEAGGTTGIHLHYDHTYLGPPGKVDEFWKEFATRIEAADIGVTLDRLQSVPLESHVQAYEAASRAKEGAVLLTWWEGYWSYPQARSGNFLPIDNLVKEGESDHWLLGTANFDDQFWGAPYTLEVAVLVANRRHLETAGVEVDTEFESYDHFIEACEQLKAAGITPIQAGTSDGFNAEKWLIFEQLQISEGPAEIIQGVMGELGANPPIFARPAEQLTVLNDNYMNDNVSDFTEEQANDRFLNGEAGMMLMYYAPIFAAGTPSEFEVIGFPVADAPYNRPAIAAGNTLAITSYGEGPEAAGKTIDFFHAPEQSALWWELTRTLPADDRFDAAGLPPQAQATWDLVMKRPDDIWSLWWPNDYYPVSVGFEYFYGIMQDLFAGKDTPQESAQRTEELFATFREENPEEVEVMQDFIGQLEQIT